MLIIDSKDCENIDKALKKYKKKFEKSKTRVFVCRNVWRRHVLGYYDIRNSI